MSDDEPREYDRAYLRPLPGPLRLRFGVTTHRGDVRRFLVQLEYWVSGEWREVVRDDHDPEAPDEQAYNVAEEGLHVDIYREGEKVRTERVSAPLPAAKAFFERAEGHLPQHLKPTVREIREMARNQKPMNDEDLERAKDEIRDAFEEVRADAEEGDEEAVADGAGDENQ